MLSNFRYFVKMFLHKKRHSFGLINTDKGIFGTMTAGQGLELLRGRVSNLGLRFMEFIKTPE